MTALDLTSREHRAIVNGAMLAADSEDETMDEPTSGDDLKRAIAARDFTRAALNEAQRRYNEAGAALREMRKAIVAAGGNDIGLEWPLGTILDGDPQHGRVGRYVLALGWFGDPIMRKLTKSGTVHQGSNPIPFAPAVQWVEVKS